MDHAKIGADASTAWIFSIAKTAGTAAPKAADVPAGFALSSYGDRYELPQL